MDAPVLLSQPLLYRANPRRAVPGRTPLHLALSCPAMTAHEGSREEPKLLRAAFTAFTTPCLARPNLVMPRHDLPSGVGPSQVWDLHPMDAQALKQSATVD